MRHDLVAVDQLARVVGHGRQHGCDQLGIGRQRDVFLGARVDGGDGCACIVADAAGDDRRGDALGFEPQHQVTNVERDVHHQQIGAAARAQHVERLIDIDGVRDTGALVHRELGRGCELAVEASDDEEAHCKGPLLF